MKLEEIENLVREGKDLEDIFSIISWKEFEEKIEEIFKTHGFKTRKNFVFKTSKRFEIDILAEKRDLVFIVDCKQWGKGRYKISSLKKAAEKNLERMKELQNTLLGRNKKIIPIIVTLLDECFYEHDGVYIVPLFKLNNFLLQF